MHECNKNFSFNIYICKCKIINENVKKNFIVMKFRELFLNNLLLTYSILKIRIYKINYLHLN